MKDLMKELLIIQDRDRQILQLKREIQDLPKRKKEIEEALADTKNRIEANQTELKSETAQTRQIENEIESIREQIKKYRKQQLEIKSNEEYRAIEKEIQAAREKISELEDQELEVMEQIDATESDGEDLTGHLKEEQEAVQAELEALDERIQYSEKELAEVSDERKKLAADIDPAWLKRYEQIMARRRDYALVPINTDCICGGCHMKLQPQMRHDVMRGERMVTCSYCGRMLYID